MRDPQLSRQEKPLTGFALSALEELRFGVLEPIVGRKDLTGQLEAERFARSGASDRRVS